MSDDKQQRVGMRKRLLNAITASMDEFHKLPWEAADAQSAARPFNPASGVVYRGGNVTNLLVEQIERGSDDPRWMTLKQANAIGYGVRPGARGAVVEYWDFGQNKPPSPQSENSSEEKAEDERKVAPKPFYAVVFNGADVTGLPPFKQNLASPEENTKALIEALHWKGKAHIYFTNPKQQYDNMAPYEPTYDASKDVGSMPTDDADKFYRSFNPYSENPTDMLVTKLHIMAQWTGHSSRLNRITNDMQVGDENHSKELLRADLAVMLLKNTLGLKGEVYKPVDRSEQIATFLKDSKNGKDEIFRAARDAEKIVEYLFSFAPELKAQIDAQTKANIITERKKPVQISSALAGLPNFIPVDAAPKEGRNDPRWQAYSDTVSGSLGRAGYSTEVIEKSVMAIEPQFTTVMNAGKAKGKTDSELYAVFTQKIIDQLKPAKMYTNIWDSFCTEAKTINAEKNAINPAVLSVTLSDMGTRFNDLIKNEPTTTDADRVALRAKINNMLYGQPESGHKLTTERLIALCSDQELGSEKELHHKAGIVTTNYDDDVITPIGINHDHADDFADDMGIMDDVIITGYQGDLSTEDDIDFDYSDMTP